MIRTDLVMESCEILKESNFDLGTFSGVKSEEFVSNTCKVTKISILNDDGAKKIGKPIGEYFTIEIEDKSTKDIIFCLKNILIKLLPAHKKALICGIGNRNLTSDALGPFVSDKTVVTRHLLDIDYFKDLNEVSAISTGVLGRTGIETFSMIKGVCNDVKPNVVIVIDALAARKPERLGTVIQVSNTGLTPGSGVSNGRQTLDKNSLGALVIAIGVPTVITGQTLVYETLKSINTNKLEDFVVTPKEIDSIISKSSKIIADAINFSLNPSLDDNDIEMFLE